MKLMKSTVTVAAVLLLGSTASRKRRPVRSLTSVCTRAICSRLRAPSRRKCATRAVASAGSRPGNCHRAAGQIPLYLRETVQADHRQRWHHGVADDEDLNQVTIRKLGDTVSEQPLALLLDPTAADKLFELKALDPAGSIGYVEAKSKKADAPFTDLRVAMVALQPKELTWRDALQNANTIRFGDLAKNGKLGADAFSFAPPKGADVLKRFNFLARSPFRLGFERIWLKS